MPEVARTIGRLLNEWKRATSDLTSSFTDNDAFRDWDQRRKDYLNQVEGEAPPSTDPLVEHHHENPHPDETYPVELGPQDSGAQLELKIEDESDGGGKQT